MNVLSKNLSILFFPILFLGLFTYECCGAIIPRAAWSLHYVDSEELDGENGAAVNSFDGNVNTFWHTEWDASEPPHPHEIQIDLGGVYDIDGFRYLPRQDGCPNGNIAQYEFYISTDGSSWGSIVTGTFANDAIEKEVTFSPVTGQYIRLQALNEVNGNPWTSMAELNLLGEISSGNQAPNGVIDTPVGDVTITVGQSEDFSGTGSDPDGDPLSYLWEFGEGSGIPVSTQKDPGLKQFDNVGTFTVKFTVTDDKGLSDPTPATRIVTVTVTGNQAPNGVIDTPEGDVTITVGQSEDFSGTGSDPDGDPLSFLWEFGEGSGLLNSTDEDPGSKQFDNAGTFTVTFTVTDDKDFSDPTPATRIITVQSGAVIPQTNWSLCYVDSEELVGEDGAAINSFDGNVNTFWHTEWDASEPPHPHEIQIDLGGVYDIDGFRYLPRQDGCPNGNIAQYEFYISTDGSSWGSIVTGTFANDAIEKEVTFSPVTGQYIRLQALNEVNGNPWTSMAELNLLGEISSGNQAPNGVIDTPVGDVTITVGQSEDFSGTGSDPDGDPLSYLWEFGEGSGIPVSTQKDPGLKQFDNVGTFTVKFTVTDDKGLSDPTPATRIVTVTVTGNQAPNGVIDTPEGDVTITVGQSEDFSGTGSDPDGDPLSFLWEFGEGSGLLNSTDEDPGSKQFDNAGTFTVTFTVTDDKDFSDPTPATRIITVQSGAVIPQTNWSLCYVDSEELVGEDGAAINSFDGNVNTFWHTEWKGSSPSHPHEIQINLGGVYDIDGFRYLPRQDGCPNGNIAQYEFYISTDGSSWGSIVTGTFANDAIEKEVTFSPVTGQYIRLQALNEVNGNPWTSIAELNLLASCVVPSVVILEPESNSLQASPDLYVLVNACLAAGQGVKISLDGGVQSIEDYWFPYEITFEGVSLSEHIVDAFVIDDGGQIPGTWTHYQVWNVGIGDYYVAMGDSITFGGGDDDTSDDISLDGRNYGGGYEPILNDMLTAAKEYPHTIINEGVGGTVSSDGASSIQAILEKHSEAQRFLVQYGTNDARPWLPVPSGLGKEPGDDGYPGSFKDNMQQIIDKINTDGRETCLAKAPIALANCNACEPYPDPDTGQRNVLIKEYNQVIDELVSNLLNQIDIIPPDFYTYFNYYDPATQSYRYETEYFDNLHPNGEGYRSMAEQWLEALPQ